MRGSKGFTLAEILLAIAIFAIIVSVLYSSYTGIFTMVADNGAQAEIYHKARITLERMVGDLESIYKDSASKKPLFLGQNREIKEKSADAITFISRSHIDFGNPTAGADKAIITYDVSEDEGGGGLELLRHDTPVIGTEPEEEEPGLVLCDHLKSVEITYADAGGELFDDWDASSVQFLGVAPAVVTVRLELINPANPHQTFKFMSSAAMPKIYAREQLPTAHAND